MKLHISPEVYQQVMYWVNKADFEVSGLGIVKIINNLPVVTKAILLEQEGTGGDTELDPNAITKAEFEMRNEEGELRWWWHSHVNMGVFWSKTDQDTIKQLGQHGWFYHTVFNKKYEKKTAFSCPQKLECPLYEKSYIYIDEEYPDEIGMPMLGTTQKQLDSSFARNVKKKEWTGGNHANNYKGQDYYRDRLFVPLTKEWRSLDEMTKEEREYMDNLDPKNEPWRTEEYQKMKARAAAVSNFKKKTHLTKKENKALRKDRMQNGLLSDISSKGMLEAEVEDMILEGYSDRAIESILREQMKRFGLNLGHLRQEVMSMLAMAHGVS